MWTLYADFTENSVLTLAYNHYSVKNLILWEKCLTTPCVEYALV